jgi:hypothetical protein
MTGRLQRRAVFGFARGNDARRAIRPSTPRRLTTADNRPESDNVVTGVYDLLLARLRWQNTAFAALQSEKGYDS